MATIWPSTAVPGTVDGGPDSAVELGVKFRSDVAGSITGIRFYKATANTGTHVGNLWSSTGTLLGSITFSNETASGWQQMLLLRRWPSPPTPSMWPRTMARLATTAKMINYFLSNGVNNPPLHALTNGVSGGNGVYAYGASSAFPSQTWIAANYWVDVVFQAAAAPTLTSIAVTPANPTNLVGAHSNSRRRDLLGRQHTECDEPGDLEFVEARRWRPSTPAAWRRRYRRARRPSQRRWRV